MSLAQADHHRRAWLDIGPIREREGHQTNVKARPARLTLLSPELEGLLPTELQPAFQERNGLIRQQLPNRYL